MGLFGNNFGSNWSYHHATGVVKNRGAGAKGRRVRGYRQVQTIVQRIAIKCRIIRPKTFLAISVKCHVCHPKVTFAVPVKGTVLKDKKAELQKILGILKSIKEVDDLSKKD